MFELQIRKGVVEEFESIGFKAEVSTWAPVPPENNSLNSENYYNRLSMSAVRTGSIITLAICYNSPNMDGWIRDDVKVMNIHLAKNGDLPYFLETGMADERMVIRPTKVGKMTLALPGKSGFFAPNTLLTLRNEEGRAHFEFRGRGINPGTSIEAVEGAEPGIFKIRTMRFGWGTMLGMQDLLRLRRGKVVELKFQDTVKGIDGNVNHSNVPHGLPAKSRSKT
jgi:hypothetical protein